MGGNGIVLTSGLFDSPSCQGCPSMGKLSVTLLPFLRLAVFALLAFAGMSGTLRAAQPDLPTATASPLAGIGFDDRPLFLPVQKNFQMAMLTAGSELGRSCGRMEAYGWRMGAGEQGRVDQIFSSTVDRFRGLGYAVETQSPASVSKDITIFTADKSNKHFMTMWSAGEIGLVMVLCETASPHKVFGKAAKKPAKVEEPADTEPAAPSVETFATPPASGPGKAAFDKFQPAGKWVGSYVCGQGYTGATLTIGALRGDSFEGQFHFYPTAKNPSVPDGAYTVYGQYDRGSQRVLINPGRWEKRPENYYNTILIGSFDPATETLSAYFQGVNGCTSFEAKRTGREVETLSLHHKHIKAAPKKAVKAKKAAKKAAAEPVREEAKGAVVSPASIPVMSIPDSDINKPAAAPALAVPAPAAKPAPAPASLAPAPASLAPAPAAPAPAVKPDTKADAAPAAAPSTALPAPANDKPPLVVGAPTPGPATVGTSAAGTGFLAPTTGK